jgi:hypothetical protein
VQKLTVPKWRVTNKLGLGNRTRVGWFLERIVGCGSENKKKLGINRVIWNVKKKHSTRTLSLVIHRVRFPKNIACKKSTLAFNRG